MTILNTMNSPASTDQLILELERASGFRNLRIAKRHDKAGWTIYYRYKSKKDDQWHADYIGAIDGTGRVSLSKVNRISVAIVNVAMLPAERVASEGKPAENAATLGDTMGDQNPFVEQ